MDADDNVDISIDGQVVLILVGLIASGKSTFAQALSTHYPLFVRCNQDDLGDRRAVEALARRSLRDRLSVCIDRTNFDESQREHWINIAREFENVQVWILCIDTPYKVCAERLRARSNHPTIVDVETGLSALARFFRQLEWPSPHEGYDRLLRLRPSNHPSATYSASDVRDILHNLRDSADTGEEQAQPNSQQNSPMQFFRGMGRRRGSGSSAHWRARPPHYDGHQMDNRYQPPYMKTPYRNHTYDKRGIHLSASHRPSDVIPRSGGSENPAWRSQTPQATTSNQPEYS